MATQVLNQRENILPNFGVEEKALMGASEVLGRLIADEVTFRASLIVMTCLPDHRVRFVVRRRPS